MVATPQILLRQKITRRHHESLRYIKRMQWQEDSQLFTEALGERESNLLQRLAPVAHISEGALDTTLYRGTLLVAYTALDSVLIALGTNLKVLRQIYIPKEVWKKVGPRATVASVAFRSADAAVAVAIGDHVVIYHGWWDEQDPSKLWTCTSYEAVLSLVDVGQVGTISTVSFSRDSRRLAAVGDGIRVWESSVGFDQGGRPLAPLQWKTILRVDPENSSQDTRYTLGSIAPTGNLVAAATKGSDSGRVWRLGYIARDGKEGDVHVERASSLPHFPKDTLRRESLDETHRTEHEETLSWTDLSFGRSGVSALSWKPRGGGQPALLAVDVDGQMHLFAKVPRSIAASGSWMEEVARTPHVEGSGRCSGTFVDWGGGGGAAADENDAVGTSLGNSLVNNAAPRPSRCYHWAVMVAGTDVKAWRAGGLDDRPKAAFARLEPGAEGEIGVVNPEAKGPHKELHVVACTSMAPVPLTCITEENSRLVKGYAISNGERRIRSAEPPEPPQITATFTLSYMNGQAYLSRWDQCPFARSPAICRARGGVGHRSSVARIVAAPESPIMARNGIVMASLGVCGEVLLWSLSAGSPFTPLHMAGRLKGPHTAVSLVPERINQEYRTSADADANSSLLVGVQTLDNSVNVYVLCEDPFIPRFRSNSFEPFPYAKKLSSVPSESFKVERLHIAHDRADESSAIVLGLDSDGTSLAAWKVFVLGEMLVEKAELRLIGDFTQPIVSSSVCTTINGQSQIICGGPDGRIRIYNISSVMDTNGSSAVILEDLITLRCGDSDGSTSAIVEIAALPISSRIAALQEDGTLTIFGSFNDSGSGWRRELGRSGLGARRRRNVGALAFGRELKNLLYLTVAMEGPDRGIRVFTRAQGLDWRAGAPFGQTEMMHSSLHATAFIMPGILVTVDRASLLVFSLRNFALLSESSAMTMYDPSNILEGMLWIGRPAREVVSIMNLLGSRLEAVEKAKGNPADPNLRPQAAPLKHFLDSPESSPPVEYAHLVRLSGWLQQAQQQADVTEQRRFEMLSALAQGCQEVAQALSSLDELGAAYALTAATFLKDPRPKPEASLNPSTIATALHSSSVDALIDMFVQSPFGGGKEDAFTWDYCRSLGVGWWVRSTAHVKTLSERIARNIYVKTKDPDECAMWYIALGKAKALAALYRTRGNVRMFEFLKRDFSMEEHQLAAAKNAYVLMSKHRLDLAAGFFLLAGDHQSATQIVCSRSKDSQLALLLARLVADGSMTLVDEVMHLLATQAGSEGKRHEEAMALWLLGQHQEALTAAALASKVPDAPSGSEDEPQVSTPAEEWERLELNAALGALNHVLAIGTRPSMRGDETAQEKIAQCRSRAAAALASEGDPVEALAVMIELLKTEGASEVIRARQLVKHVTRRALTWRAVGHATAIRDAEALALHVLEDVQIISDTVVGFEIAKSCAINAAHDLAVGEETGAAVALAVAALSLDERGPSQETSVDADDSDFARAVRRVATHHVISLKNNLSVDFEQVLQKVMVQSLHRTTSMFSHFRTRWTLGTGGRTQVCNAQSVQHAATNLETAIKILRSSSGLAKSLFLGREGDLVRAMNLLFLSNAFLSGDWAKMRRLIDVSKYECQPDSCEVAMDHDAFSGDNLAEELRRMADRPLLHSWMINSMEDAGRTRRLRVSRQFGRVDFRDVSSEESASKKNAVTEGIGDDKGGDAGRKEDVVRSSKRATKLIREQQLLSSVLSATALAALTSYVAQMATARKDAKSRSGLMDMNVLVDAETIDAMAMDAVYGWYPLVKFGRDRTSGDISDEDVTDFTMLWKSLASLPDFAPYLREAATVAAALDTSTAEHFHRSTRDSEYLHNPFPVRFSAAATGPWSGRGMYSVLFREEGALIRSLCVASTDPPLIAFSTPRGIQKVIPDSYAYSKPPQEDLKNAERNSSSGGIRRSGSWSFFESEYEPLVLYGEEKSITKPSPDSVTLSETEASALASHPRRRRFASGGTDGVVRLWGFGENVSHAGLRDRHHGRVVALQYSAYGDGLLCVYSSGHIAVWHDPDVYSSHASGIHEGDAVVINAYGNRRASEAIFLDERNIIASVGDPFGAQGAGTSNMGHSLRVYDIRVASASYRASWTARVHNGGEARCLTLLEDRMRLVTGGCDGSMSVVDARTQTCVAELPAHDDEVICLRMEVPRGRALASGCRNGDIKIWDARTLRVLDLIPKAHNPTRQWLTGTGFGGLVGVHGVRDICLTDRALISCGGDGLVKIWGPGWGDFDHQVL